MDNSILKQKLTNTIYKDASDVVALRYLILHTLVQCADEYKKARGTACSFRLLQHHKKLGQFNVVIKEKSRVNTASKEDFEEARSAAIECLEHVIFVQAFVSAA